MIKVDFRVDLADARQRVHDPHLLLRVSQDGVVNNISVLDAVVFRKIGKPLLLHAGDVEDVGDADY